MEQLAINGGKPVRDSKIYYGQQWITEEDVQAVAETLRSNYLTTGPKVTELEKKLCEYTGASYATAVCNGTAALHIACMAAGIGEGDEVITTALTFMASANCALYCGAKPVFADISETDYNISVESIRSKITGRTKAIVAVDFAGVAIDHEAIRKICDENNLVFIEDAAHAIGTSRGEKRVGNIADMTCFSFHPVKTVTSGEGGAVMTNNLDYHKKLQILRSHGIVREEEDMIDLPREGAWVYEQQCLGYNYRITDFQAALLISQLSRIDMFISRRQEIVNRYNEAFKDMPELLLQSEPDNTKSGRHLYTIRVNRELLNCTRAEFFNAMSAENIQCQVHYIPVYWSPYYRKLGYRKGICPNAEKVYSDIISIPLYPKLTDEEVEDVITAVKKIVDNYKNK